MRLLVACPKCHRQYDARGRRPGSRFRCHCGEAVTVHAPRGHDARVVRCSGCGAPREEGSSRCAFCHADFTLHERDLHTVCPVCMCRVSDRAKFCHSCGSELGFEMTVDEITELSCPACGKDSALVSRMIGDGRVSVMECPRCVGLWLSQSTFVRLTVEATRATSAAPALGPRDSSRRTKVAAPPPAPQTTRRSYYRPCVVCAKLMQRTQYGHGSGVVIDVCYDHGVWFDANELPQILAWLRGGGPKQIEAAAQMKEALFERAREKTRQDRDALRPFAGRRGAWPTLADQAVDVLRQIFWS